MKTPFAPQLFSNAGQEYLERYPTTTKSHLARIAEKNHKHSAINPRSQFRDVYTFEQIMKSRRVTPILTMLQCCPTSDGAAAAIVCSEKFVREHNLQHRAVEIIGMTMATDFSTTFKDQSAMNLIGFDMAKRAAKKGYPIHVVDSIFCTFFHVSFLFSHFSFRTSWHYTKRCTSNRIGMFQ